MKDFLPAITANCTNTANASTAIIETAARSSPLSSFDLVNLCVVHADLSF